MEFISSKQWLCSVHGRVSDVTLNYDGEVIGRYCFLCCNEFLKKNLPAVTPFIEGSDDK